MTFRFKYFVFPAQNLKNEVNKILLIYYLSQCFVKIVFMPLPDMKLQGTKRKVTPKLHSARNFARKITMDTKYASQQSPISSRGITGVDSTLPRVEPLDDVEDC